MKLLIPEPPLQVLPTLAARIGVNEAIFVQQLHYWTQRAKDPEGWVYKTLDDWQAELPWLTARTLQRVIGRCRDAGAIDVRQPRGRDRTNHYRLDYSAPCFTPDRPVHDDKSTAPSRQSDVLNDGAETTQETTQENTTPALLPTAPQQVFDHWVSTMGKNGATRLDDTRRRRINARLREGLTVPDLCRAIDGCAASDYHMKRGRHANRDGIVYDELKMILRDRPQVEKLMAIADESDRPGRDYSQYDRTAN